MRLISLSLYTKGDQRSMGRRSCLRFILEKLAKGVNTPIEFNLETFETSERLQQTIWSKRLLYDSVCTVLYQNGYFITLHPLGSSHSKLSFELPSLSALTLNNKYLFILNSRGQRLGKKWNQYHRFQSIHLSGK